MSAGADRQSTSASADSEAQRCADFIGANMPALLRRIRSIRSSRANDWQLRTSELFSTASRRILSAPHLRTVAVEPRAFLAILDTVVRRAIIDRVRRLRCQRRASLLLANRVRPARSSHGAEALAEIVEQLTEEERTLLTARLRGDAWAAAAVRLGITEAAARQRWCTIRKRLAEAVTEA